MSHAENGSWRKAERRAAARFAIEREVRYRLIDRRAQQAGSGQTVNISSRGLLFTTDQPLQPGEMLEISVQWPAKLDNSCPLKLVASGRVVRSQNGLAAASIERYEFRTQGSRSFAAGGR